MTVRIFLGFLSFCAGLLLLFLGGACALMNASVRGHTVLEQIANYFSKLPNLLLGIPALFFFILPGIGLIKVGADLFLPRRDRDACGEDVWEDPDSGDGENQN